MRDPMRDQMRDSSGFLRDVEFQIISNIFSKNSNAKCQPPFSEAFPPFSNSVERFVERLSNSLHTALLASIFPHGEPISPA